MAFFQHRAFQSARGVFFSAPRRPRHPLLRFALGVVGVALLAALVVLGVFVGAAMLAGGMAMRLWSQRGQSRVAPRRTDSIEGACRVVGKVQLPLAR